MPVFKLQGFPIFLAPPLFIFPRLDAAFLVSDGAKAITGNVAYVDAGYHVTG